MASHGDQLKSAIGISALVSFYGIASLLVVFIGPKFGFGYTEQIIIIVLILLTWPFVVLFNYIRRRRSEKAEAKEAAAAQAAQPGGDFEEPRTGAPPARV